MNYIASYRMRYESCCARLYIVQVRPGCAFVLEWNLPFRNPGSATAVTIYRLLTFDFTVGLVVYLEMGQ